MQGPELSLAIWRSLFVCIFLLVAEDLNFIPHDWQNFTLLTLPILVHQVFDDVQFEVF